MNEFQRQELEGKMKMEPKYLWLTGVLVLLLLASLAFGLYQLNAQQKDRAAVKRDQATIIGLRNIYTTTYASEERGTIPIEELVKGSSVSHYRLSDSAYALCATFEADSPKEGPMLPIKGEPKVERDAQERLRWVYKRGKTCFLNLLSSKSAGDPPDATVTLDVFSGLPNPTWQLSRAQLYAFSTMFSGFPKSFEKGIIPDDLGYRGFHVVLATDNKSIVDIVVYKNIIRFITENQDLDPFVLDLFDPERSVEQWLLATNPSLSRDLINQ